VKSLNSFTVNRKMLERCLTAQSIHKVDLP